MAFVGLRVFTDSLWMFPGQNKNVTKMWQLSHRLYTVWKGFCHILNTFLFPVSFLLHFWTILSVFCHNLVFESLIICLLSSYNLLSHFCQIFVNFCYIFVTFWKLRDLNWSPVPVVRRRRRRIHSSLEDFSALASLPRRRSRPPLHCPLLLS